MTPEDAIAAIAAGRPTQNDRTWGMLAHLSSLSGFLLPFGNLIGPLIIWQVKKNQSAFASESAREALNFNITVLLIAAVCSMLIFVLIGFLILVSLGLYWVVLTVIAGVRASEGTAFHYPFTLRIVK